MMTEVVVIPTYHRPEMLYCCLQRIRAIEPAIPISIFPDRGSLHDDELQVVKTAFPHNVQWNWVADHDYHGNTANVMEALRWAFNEGPEGIFYIEDDVICHPDFFKWHREQHEERDDIFAAMGWIFNRYAPIVDDVMYAPWYYSIGTSFTRSKLGLIVEHATPRYYADMQGYIEKEFPKSALNQPAAIAHYEQDGLIQRVLDVDRSFTATPGIAKCSHMGSYGYNRGWQASEDIFGGVENFAARVMRLEEFIGDPTWRATVFGRQVVEREIGREIPKLEYTYKITLPGGFETIVTTELLARHLPRRINSVDIPPDAVFTVIGKNVLTSE